MNRIAIILLLVVAPLTIGVTGQRTSCSNGPHTLYSETATTLDGAFERVVRVPSPDKMKILSIRTVEDEKDPDGMHINYTVKIARKTYRQKLLGHNGEVKWSPDSIAFAVTQTEGGGGLGSRVYVFFVDEGGVTKVDVSRAIEKNFGHPVQCEIEIAPNTAFIDWKADSSTLLVAAEVVPVSICKCAGTYRVYEMSLPAANIVRTYSQLEAKQRFMPLLGCELRNASDRCVNAMERQFHKRKTTRQNSPR